MDFDQVSSVFIMSLEVCFEEFPFFLILIVSLYSVSDHLRYAPFLLSISLSFSFFLSPLLVCLCLCLCSVCVCVFMFVFVFVIAFVFA